MRLKVCFGQSVRLKKGFCPALLKRHAHLNYELIVTEKMFFWKWERRDIYKLQYQSSKPISWASTYKHFQKRILTIVVRSAWEELELLPFRIRENKDIEKKSFPESDCARMRDSTLQSDECFQKLEKKNLLLLYLGQVVRNNHPKVTYAKIWFLEDVTHFR